MTGADDLPLWAAVLVSALLLIGASLTLLGAIGTLRLKSFFERIHGPSLGVSWGLGATLLASIVYFSVREARPVLHEIIIGVFMMLTAPIVMILLARAVLYRERQENNDRVPSMDKVIGGKRKSDS